MKGKCLLCKRIKDVNKKSKLCDKCSDKLERGYIR